MHWSMTATVAILLFFVPAAAAGSADSPEIQDDAEDGHPVANKDLVKVWIEEATAGEEEEEEEEEEQALWFRIETGADFEHVPAFFALHEGGAGQGDEDDGHGDAHGNETLDDGDDKASPGAGWLLPLVATLLVAFVRRR